MRSVTLLAILALVGITNADAQRWSLVRVGHRVRVTVPALGIERQAGVFEAWLADTLLVRVDSTAAYPLGSVTMLEVYRGRGTATNTGLLVGGLLGATGGLAMGVAGCTGSRLPADPPSIVCAVAGAGLGGIAGAGLGMLVGGLVKTDRWEEVPLDRLRVSVVPTCNGFGLGARIAF